MAKSERLEHANALIQAISNHGRRFFYCVSTGQTSRMELDERGRVWFIDDYTGTRINVASKRRWIGFSHGGTLRDLVEAMRDYIQRGDLLHPEHIAPTRINPENGNIWGYSAEAAAALREEAYKLPLFAQRAAQAAQGGEHG